MGTTRIKLIDLSSQEQSIKTSRKHAEKLTGIAKLKNTKVPKVQKKTVNSSVPSVPSEPSQPSLPQEPSIVENGKSAQKSQVTTTSQKPKESNVWVKHHEAKTRDSGRKQARRGRKYQEAYAKIDRNTSYPPKVAIELLHKTSFTKFDPTVELHLNVSDKNLRGRANLPHPLVAKKPLKYLIFASAKPKTQDPQIIFAGESTISEIESGKLKPGRDFNIVITQPKFMVSLAKVAKILGPKGMMPNPKNSTVTEDIDKYFASQHDGVLEFKTDPTAPIIHTKVGKLSNKPVEIEENLKAVIAAIGPTKIKKAVITSTMSPSIKVDLGLIAK